MIRVEAAPRPFPLAALLALAMTGFIAIMTETLPAGLLPQISQGLAVSPALAGQLVTLYALGSLLAAIPLIALTRSWGRRKVLLSAIVGFFLFNTLTAISPWFSLTLLARFMAGAAAGLAWGLIAGYARRMVQPHQQGRAMAIAMTGTPTALALGVPLGAWLGTVLSWRSTFAIMSGLTLLLIIWVIAKVPDFPGQSSQQQQPVRKVFTTPGVRPILLVIVLWMLAHNILYTYIAPFIVPAGLGNQVDKVLLVFGISALAGIGFTGLVVDRWLRGAVLLSLTAFAVAALVLAIVGNSPAAVYSCMVLWGLSFGGAPTLLQTASADAAKQDADVAQSMIVVAWNLAIAGGGITGGLLLQSAGAVSFPWAVLGLLIIGLAIVWQAQRHGFKPGVRTAMGSAKC
ncbi:putative drug efflux protein [Yersinia frederiksenii]|uniref:MFS transporter n=1 Tax=Yersinia alsatica TaxID=2890317 RepID=UPI0005E72688|nr:MFS transporter [Yersinia alsatica]OWF74448.1 MFS transporter [Yersinia frederiksenii]CFQ42946.1 putative drug efflux protein [Yersinia frederiksenii]CNI40439.1 putative drug efflux protein [Yersinia frederiksenii]